LKQLDSGVKVPRLDGKVARLGDASLLSVINNALDTRFATKGSVAYDALSGTVTYTYSGKTLRFLPLGDPSVQLPSNTGGSKSIRAKRNRFAATNAGSAAAGAFTLVDRGVQLTLASSLGYFNELDQAVKNSDPSGKILLKSNGLVQMSMNGENYLVRPGSLVQTSGSVGKPAILLDAVGSMSFRDSKGGVQALFPAFADMTVLDRTVKSLDPKATIDDPGSGAVVLSIAGMKLNLLPALRIGKVPANHGDELFWIDGPSLYLRYPDGTAQGFTLN
jgi:hypothetical protein